MLLSVFVFGCAQQKPEIKAIPLGELDDASQATIKKIDIKDADEVDLIEQLQGIRADYKRMLVVINRWYLEHGYFQKATWAAKEFNDLKMVHTYPYLVDISIQKANLTPKDDVVAANTLYKEALKLYHEGQIAPLINDKKKLKDALNKFIRLIKKYPSSDKIDDAAFYAAEILKEYFNDNVQAVNYYELAMKWNPKTPHPVRFQCAVIYDFRLHDRKKALALYRQVLSDEADIDRTNTSFAANRIKQLLKAQKAEQSLKNAK